VQHCHVSTKHLLVDTFSCICILLSELGASSYIDLLLVTRSCRSISGDEITWHLFCVSIMAQGGDSNKHFTLNWTRLLCRSLSAKVNLSSGFVQIPAIEKAALGFLSCATFFWMQGMGRAWLLDFRLQTQLMRHDYPCYFDEFDDCVLRFPRDTFCHSVAHVYLQTSDLTFFTIEIATKFWVWCQRWLRWSRILSRKRGQRNTTLSGLLYFRCNLQQQHGNTDIKFLTIALYHTAASVFQTGASLKPFRDSIGAF